MLLSKMVSMRVSNYKRISTSIVDNYRPSVTTHTLLGALKLLTMSGTEYSEFKIENHAEKERARTEE